jgi:hypothetical protein
MKPAGAGDVVWTARNRRTRTGAIVFVALLAGVDLGLVAS